MTTIKGIVALALALVSLLAAEVADARARLDRAYRMRNELREQILLIPS